jgi:hypothetical protein
MGATSRIIKITGFFTAAGLAAGGAALAQEGGLTLNGLFRQSLEFSDNPDFTADATGTTLQSVTGLSFGLDSVTSSDALSIDVGAALRYTLATSDTQPVREGLYDPFLVIAYERNSATSLLSFGASIRESDTGDLSFVVDPDSQDLVVDDGTTTRTTLSFGLDTGIGEPFGLSVDAFYQRRTYTDTFDPDLVDNELFRFTGAARFRVTPTTTASLIAAYSDDNDFGTSDFERLTRRLGFGVDHEFSPSQAISLDVTSDVIDTTDGGITTTDEGYSFILAYDQEVTNGNFSIEASSILENIGAQNTISFSRSLDLPDGNLAFVLGINNYGSSDIYGLLGIEYARQFRDAVFSARVRQELDQSTTSNDEFLNRLIEFDYSKEINSVSSWQASVGYFQSEDLSDGSNTERSNFQISYRRDLTQDWDFVGGYRYRGLNSTDEADRTSNTLFLTLERPFETRP